MQEEVENKSVTLIINSTKFTGRVLKSAISKYLAHRSAKRREKKMDKKAEKRAVQAKKQTAKERHTRTDLPGMAARKSGFLSGSECLKHQIDH